MTCKASIRPAGATVAPRLGTSAGSRFLAGILCLGLGATVLEGAAQPAAWAASGDTTTVGTSLSIITVSDDAMYASDGVTPIDPDTSTTNNVIPSGGRAIWSVQFAPQDAAAKLTLDASLPAGDQFDSTATLAGCQTAGGVGTVGADGNTARCVIANTGTTTAQWGLAAAVSGANGTTVQLTVTAGSDNVSVTSHPLTFVGSPKFNIWVSGSSAASTGVPAGATLPAGGTAPAQGVAIGMGIHVWTPVDPTNGVKGLEPLTSSFTITMRLPASLSGVDWLPYLASNGGSGPYSPGGTGTGVSNVTNNGTWTLTKIDSTTLGITVTGADTTAAHYPTKSAGNNDLPQTMAIVTSGQVRVYLPTSQLPPNKSTAYTFQVVDFDPDSLTGQSNWGTSASPTPPSTTGYAPNQQPGATAAVATGTYNPATDPNTNAWTGTITTVATGGISTGTVGRFYAPGGTATPPGWSGGGGSGTNGPIYGNQGFDHISTALANNSPLGLNVVTTTTCGTWNTNQLGLRTTGLIASSPAGSPAAEPDSPVTGYSAGSGSTIASNLDAVYYGVTTTATACDFGTVEAAQAGGFYPSISAFVEGTGLSATAINAVWAHSASTVPVGYGLSLMRIPFLRTSAPLVGGTELAISYHLTYFMNNEGTPAKGTSTQSPSKTSGTYAYAAEVQAATTMSVTGGPISGSAAVMVTPGSTQVVTVTPSVVVPYATGAHALEGASITVTIPKSLTPVDGSWVTNPRLTTDPVTGESAVQGDPLSAAGYTMAPPSTDAQGNNVLAFSLGDLATSGSAGLPQGYPAMAFEVSATPGTVVPATGTISSVIWSNPDNGQPLTGSGGRTATADYVVDAPAILGWGLTQSASKLFPGIGVNYHLSLYNNAQRDATGISGAIILPYDGDGRGTVNLSAMRGTALTASSTAPGAAAVAFFTTVTPAATVASSVRAVADGADVTMAGGVDWLPYVSGALPTGTTAIAWRVPTVRGTDSAVGSDNYTLSFGLDDTLGFSAPTGAIGIDLTVLSYTPPTGAPITQYAQDAKRATFASATVTGQVYVDGNEDSVVDPGEAVTSGTVTLSGYSFGADQVDNNPALTADQLAARTVPLAGDDTWWTATAQTVSASGAYTFANLPSGRWVLWAASPDPAATRGVQAAPTDGPLTPFATDTSATATTQNVRYVTVPFPIYLLVTGRDADGVVGPVDGSAWQVLADDAGAAGAVLDMPVTPLAGESGRYVIDGMTPGAYWLVTTTAAPGHNLLAEPVAFTVGPAGTLSLPGTGAAIASVGTTPDGEPQLTVVLTPTLVLPATGGPGTTAFTVAGVALLALALLGAASYTTVASRWDNRCPRVPPVSRPGVPSALAGSGRPTGRTVFT